MQQPYVRPGIDDRPDLDKALSPEDKAAVARLAVRSRRRPPEASATQAETQAASLASAGSPATAAASVDAAVPDMTSSFLDMRDPMVAADGERPGAGQVLRLKCSFALSAVLSTAAWVALTMVALPAAVARAARDFSQLVDDGFTGAALERIGDIAVPLAVIIAIGALVSVVANLFVSALSDRTRVVLGRRTPWIVAGGVLSALFVLILGVANTFGSIGVMWALLNASYAMLVAPVNAAFSERVPDKFRVSLVRWRGIGQMLGQAVGAWIGTLCFAFSTHFTYETFVAAAILFVACGVLTVTVWPKEPSSEEQPLERLRWSAVFDQLRPPRNAPRFWAMFWARLTMMAAVALTGVFLWYIVRYFAASNGVGVELAYGLFLRPWFVIAAMALATLIGSAFAARVAGPIDERCSDMRRPVWAACALYAVALLVGFQCHANAIGLMVFALLAGFAFGLFDALGQELVMGALPDPRRSGHDLGVFNLSNALGLAAGALLGAAALTVGGPVATTVFGAGALFLVAIVCVAVSAAMVARGGR